MSVHLDSATLNSNISTTFDIYCDIRGNSHFSKVLEDVFVRKKDLVVIFKIIMIEILHGKFCLHLKRCFSENYMSLRQAGLILANSLYGAQILQFWWSG